MHEWRTNDRRNSHHVTCCDVSAKEDGIMHATDRYRVEVRWLRNKAGRPYKRYVVIDFRTGEDVSRLVTRPTAYAIAGDLNYGPEGRTA
jgi:hypothetical protein